ncbi:hypothetical protein PJI17_31625, partial [Mycobacterium kansasii]
ISLKKEKEKLVIGLVVQNHAKPFPSYLDWQCGTMGSNSLVIFPTFLSSQQDIIFLFSSFFVSSFFLFFVTI